MHIYFDGICIGSYLYDVGKYNPSSNPHGCILRKSGIDPQQDGNGERGVFLCELAYNTASLLTLGAAISKSGAAPLISDTFLRLFGEETNKTFILVVFFVLIVIITQFMSNGATAAVFYPIGLSVAQQLNVSPVAALMMVCVAAGSSFATPMATPLNAYLMSVSGCRFSDYMKVGVPLLLLTTIVCVILCPLIWRIG